MVIQCLIPAQKYDFFPKPPTKKRVKMTSITQSYSGCEFLHQQLYLEFFGTLIFFQFICKQATRNTPSFIIIQPIV
jgi:hypothetical protein